MRDSKPYGSSVKALNLLCCFSIKFLFAYNRIMFTQPPRLRRQCLERRRPLLYETAFLGGGGGGQSNFLNEDVRRRKRKCVCLGKHSTREILTVLTRTKHGRRGRVRQFPVRSCKFIDYFQNLLEDLHTVQAYTKFRPPKNLEIINKENTAVSKRSEVLCHSVKHIIQLTKVKACPISLCDVTVNPQREERCLDSIT